MAIKYIMDTYVNQRSKGNYHIARITSIKTGRNLLIDGGWGSDPSNILSLIPAEWHEIHCTTNYMKPREFARCFGGKAKHWEHDVTSTMIKRLGRKHA